MLAKVGDRHAREVGVFPELAGLVVKARLISGYIDMEKEEMEESRTSL